MNGGIMRSYLLQVFNNPDRRDLEKNLNDGVEAVSARARGGSVPMDIKITLVPLRMTTASNDIYRITVSGADGADAQHKMQQLLRSAFGKHMAELVKGAQVRKGEIEDFSGNPKKPLFSELFSNINGASQFFGLWSPKAAVSDVNRARASMTAPAPAYL